MRAEDVVGRQVDAYNAHDLEAFAECYTDDVVVMTGTGEVLLEGIDALQSQYGDWFRNMPDLRADIRARTTRGPWVVDDEHAAAPSAGLVIEALVAYHVRSGRIDRVILMAPSAEDEP